MELFINTFLSSLSAKFYIYQVLAILIFVLYGLVFMLILRGREITKFDLLLAYPISLVLYSVTGLLILSIGIPFNKVSIIALMLLVLVKMAIMFRDKIGDICFNKSIVIFIAVAVILALVSASGILRISVTNDSMYFFSEYPRAIVHYGKLTSIFDHFLTDAAQGIAVIGTIPALFGFDEFFGIQILLNINFVCIFAYSLYDYTKGKIAKNKGVLIAVISVIVLMTSMPFVIMSKWSMANAFFMEYMVIVCIVAYKYSGTAKKQDLIIIAVLLTGLSIMRIEGALYVGVIILCIMMLKYNNLDIVKYFVCPMTVLQILYLLRIFAFMTLHTFAQFMTKEKAIILIAFLAMIIIYNLVVRDRLFAKYKKYYPVVITLGLLVINVLALIYKTDRYIANLKAFSANLLRNSGWGLFVPFVIGVLILVPKKSIKVSYFDYVAICYVLLAVIAGWARGDALVENFGDSGNRIMIQAVPIILFALMVKVIEGLEYWEKESLN